jgi:hypothetical protein
MSKQTTEVIQEERKESAMPQNIQELNPVFRSPWGWHRPVGDPGPDWNVILSSLDKNAITQLAAVQVAFATKEVEAQKIVLDAQLKALSAMQEIIKGASMK